MSGKPEPKPIPKSEIFAICSEIQDPETEGFQFLRTAYRVKDPKRSIKFYNCLGMTLLNAMDVPHLKASVYSIGYLDPKTEEKVPPLIDSDTGERNIWGMSRPNTLELAYTWGTEDDPAFNYKLGTGFSNITIMVPDVRKATERLQDLGVVFSETPDEGVLKGLAYFPDPDGYVIEMYDNKAVRENMKSDIIS